MRSVTGSWSGSGMRSGSGTRRGTGETAGSAGSWGREGRRVWRRWWRWAEALRPRGRPLPLAWNLQGRIGSGRSTNC